jgi:hypothetical protein
VFGGFFVRVIANCKKRQGQKNGSSSVWLEHLWAKSGCGLRASFGDNVDESENMLFLSDVSLPFFERSNHSAYHLYIFVIPHGSSCIFVTGSYGRESNAVECIKRIASCVNFAHARVPSVITGSCRRVYFATTCDSVAFRRFFYCVCCPRTSIQTCLSEIFCVFLFN